LLIKQRNLSQRAVELFRCLRHSLARAGSAGKRFLAVGANSSCNRTLFTAALERIVVIARTPRCEVMQTCADLIALLHKEMIETAALLATFRLKLAWKTLGLAAAA
jgi:hypothetical protein